MLKCIIGISFALLPSNGCTKNDLSVVPCKKKKPNFLIYCRFKQMIKSNNKWRK